MFVTFFDTWMVTLVALIVWRFPPYLVLLPALVITCMDGAFLSAALTKVPHGAWLTIAMSTILAAIFTLWRFGKESQWTAEREDRLPLSQFIEVGDHGEFKLVATREQQGGEVLSISKGFGIFFDKSGIHTPQVFNHFINKLVVTPEVIVFFHLRPLEYPTVPAAERFIVSQIKFLPNCYRVVCRHGYMDEVVTSDLASIIYGHVQSYVRDKMRFDPTTTLSRTSTIDEKAQIQDPEDKDSPESNVAETNIPTTSTLAQLERAYNHRVLYIIGKEEMHIKRSSPLWRRVVLAIFLFLRDNSRNKVANLKVPTDRLVEIGFVKDV
jgi:KUP system potassium uptake protein